MPEIKERPILFSTPMVQAIIKGRKTQTRRVMKHQPVFDEDSGYIYYKNYEYQIDIHRPDLLEQFCPYGQVGDRLWVKETWQSAFNKIWYKADGIPYHDAADTVEDVKWRPSIFMPRNSCRLMLEITEARLERLQEVSQVDAMDEGVYLFDCEWVHKNFKQYAAEYNIWLQGDTDRVKPPLGPSPVERFRVLWDQINGKKHPWDSNPWLWVISFKKVMP